MKMTNKELEKKLDVVIENFLQDYEDEETLVSLGLEEEVVTGLNIFTKYTSSLKNIELGKVTHSITILSKANADLALENMLHTEIYENLDKISLIAILTSNDYDGFGRYLNEKRIAIPNTENITMAKLQMFFASHFELYVSYYRDFFGYECLTNSDNYGKDQVDGKYYFMFLNEL